MDEYLSEKEQIERIKGWWSDNGWYLIGGIAIGLLGLFGYRQYEAYTNTRAEDAAALYQALEAAVDDDDIDEVDVLLAELRADHGGSPYTDHAGLLTARLVLVRDSARAAAELRRVIESTRDSELAMIARLRLARVLAYREEYDAALEILRFDEPGQFASRISDIRGDIYLAQGDTDAARAAFAEALVAPGADMLDRNFVQMKLGELLSTIEAQSPENDG